MRKEIVGVGVETAIHVHLVEQFDARNFLKPFFHGSVEEFPENERKMSNNVGEIPEFAKGRGLIGF